MITAAQHPMVVAINLVKHYDDGLVRALNGVSFTVGKGEHLAIMGPSGCGKSTLLNLLGALDMPTAGEIIIDGKRMGDYKPFDRFRATTVGFIFQLHHLVPALSLLENVELPMYSLALSRKERRERASALLSQMGLAGRMHFPPTRVSGGERQRAAIARAIVNDPTLILADEPTGNVDSETGGMILNLLVNLCRTRQITMLLATHNREIAARADRIMYMRSGLIEKDL